MATDGVHGPKGSSQRHGGDCVYSVHSCLWGIRFPPEMVTQDKPPQLQTSQNISFGSHFWGHITHLFHCHTSESGSRTPIFKLRRTPAIIPSSVVALQSFRWHLPGPVYNFNHKNWMNVPFVVPCFIINSNSPNLMFTHMPNNSCCWALDYILLLLWCLLRFYSF